jgi:hypothetical protein
MKYVVGPGGPGGTAPTDTESAIHVCANEGKLTAETARNSKDLNFIYE